MKLIFILIVTIGLFSFGCNKSPTTEKKLEINSATEIQSPETIQIPEEDERNHRLISSPEYPQYWANILHREFRTYAGSYVFNEYTPPPDVVLDCWKKITAMSPEKAWVIFTQIEEPDSATIFSADRVIDWAHEHVPSEYILELILKPGDTRIYNPHRFKRWAYFYIRKHGGETEKISLKEMLSNEKLLESKIPRGGGVYIDIYLSYASLLNESEKRNFLMDAFKREKISLQQIYEEYGVEGVCEAAVLLPEPHLTYPSSSYPFFTEKDRYKIYSQLLELLKPYSGTDEDAVGRWKTIILVIRNLEKYGSKNIKLKPQKIEDIIKVVEDRDKNGRDDHIEDNKIWVRSGDKGHFYDFNVFNITELLELRDQWLEAIYSAEKDIESFSPEEVNAQIESLREFIIPPKGVGKKDVDAVFGVPEEFYGSLFNKVSPDTLMYKYQLLTPEPRQEFRAYLYVKYNDDKVEYIGISHYRTVGNLYSGGTERQELIERNNKFILKDLIEIEGKYKSQLENASWNK